MYLKISLVAVFTIIILSCSSNQSLVNVPPGQVIELDYPNYNNYQVTIRNRGFGGVKISVLSKKENRQVRGFGLGAKAKVNVLVETENKLVIENENTKAAQISFITSLKKEENNDNSVAKSSLNSNEKTVYKRFTLVNSSNKEIPLLIPNVMNPNLSPNSTSGVDLKLGQEILFRYRGKKYILLTVGDSIANGDKLDVPLLLEARKKSLGLK